MSPCGCSLAPCRFLRCLFRLRWNPPHTCRLMQVCLVVCIFVWLCVCVLVCQIVSLSGPHPNREVSPFEAPVRGWKPKATQRDSFLGPEDEANMCVFVFEGSPFLSGFKGKPRGKPAILGGPLKKTHPNGMIIIRSRWLPSQSCRPLQLAHSRAWHADGWLCVWCLCHPSCWESQRETW